jgi:hypothetical protein
MNGADISAPILAADDGRQFVGAWAENETTKTRAISSIRGSGGALGKKTMGVANTPPPGAAGSSPEREKGDDERAFRDRKVAVKEREQQTKEAELALAQEAHAASRWKSPLVVAILAATVAALGNMLVAYTTAAQRRTLKRRRPNRRAFSK